MSQKKIITFSLSGLLFVIIGFILAYVVFDLRLVNFKKEILQAVKSNTIIGLPDSDNKSDLGDFEKKITNNIQSIKQSIVHIVGIQTIGGYLNNSGLSLNSGIVENQKVETAGGNGIIISEDGFIITNKHVVSQPNMEYKIIDFWGNIYKLDKIRSDSNTDFAIIKVKDQNGNNAKDMFPTNIISSRAKVQIGQWVFAIGNTSSENINAVTMGIISAKNKKVGGIKNIIGLYQTDASLSVGNSGGPLINTNGEVIGISTAIDNGEQSTSYVLPITKEFISWIFTSIQRNGKISYPSLGFNFIEINTTNKNELKVDTTNGIIITEIINDSEASKKGIKVGDIITGINGNEINNDNPFLYQLYGYNFGNKIVLNIQRGSKKIDIDVFLGENNQ
ncbi:MAG: trypsin-like peptidase domain-containing protein [Candidatus Absconditicoccaceae bacterium]